MKVHFFDEPFVYTGKELRSHFVRARTGMYGDAAMAWVGPCEVATETLVDLEDREAGHIIRARSMLHFIVEVFENDLLRAVYRQRLLVSIAADALREMTGQPILRKGDDLFVGSGKLSVSIATASPVSTLIHFGINVDGAGAPVETADLLTLSVDPRTLAERVLGRFAAEEEGIARARSKVRPVP
jgi:hypothetical protein